MAKMKYFNGDIELVQIHTMDHREFSKKFPGIVGRRCDSFSFYVGQPIGHVPTWNAETKSWDRKLLPVQRVIEYKSNPSKHICDSRCTNATGRIMKCECSCNGKYHGIGSRVCD